MICCGTKVKPVPTIDELCNDMESFLKLSDSEVSFDKGHVLGRMNKLAADYLLLDESVNIDEIEDPDIAASEKESYEQLESLARDLFAEIRNYPPLEFEKYPKIEEFNKKFFGILAREMPQRCLNISEKLEGKELLVAFDSVIEDYVALPCELQSEDIKKRVGQLYVFLQSKELFPLSADEKSDFPNINNYVAFHTKAKKAKKGKKARASLVCMEALADNESAAVEEGKPVCP